MPKFEDIRPYYDEEVKPTIQRLLDDTDFLNTICAFKLAKLPQWLRHVLKPLVKQRLRTELGPIDSIKAAQLVSEKYVNRVIETTISNLTISGLENLSEQRPYFYMSNHRDIVMDPALVNFALHHHGMETPQLAIGDNLLQKPYVSDLMRLCKSFIVKRSASGVREKLQAFTELSSYIQHVHNQNTSVWMAQKEGRAKNGLDSTDPAIIKMLYMSQKKSGQSFADYMRWLNIVPVAISYEYNPCDLAITKELHQTRTAGGYEKALGEDMQSISAGITGYKGDVHITFGTPLSDGLETPEDIASQIDEQIINGYRLHDSNYVAAEIIDPSSKNFRNHTVNNNKKAAFMERLNRCDKEMQDIFLTMYANPVLRQHTKG